MVMTHPVSVLSRGSGGFTGIEGQSGKNMCQPDTGKFHSSYIGMNVCGSAYENGCVVDGTCATGSVLNIIIVIRKDQKRNKAM